MSSETTTSQQSFSGLTFQEETDNSSCNSATKTEATSQPPCFKIIEERLRQYRNFETMAREVTVLVDAPPSDVNPNEWLRETFQSLMEVILTDDVAPQDKIGFTFFSAARVGQRPIGLSMRRRDQFNIDVLLQMLERCIQSNDQFLVSGKLRVVFLHARIESGGSKTDNPIIATSDFHTFCKMKRGIITITNDDNLSLARALIVAMAFLKKDESPDAKRYYDNVRKYNPGNRQTQQTAEAERLCEEVGVDLSEAGRGVEELRQFQDFLTAYTITVFTDRRGREIMFEGPTGTPDHPRKRINLILGCNHYNVITSVQKLKSYCL